MYVLLRATPSMNRQQEMLSDPILKGRTKPCCHGDDDLLHPSTLAGSSEMVTIGILTPHLVEGSCRRALQSSLLPWVLRISVSLSTSLGSCIESPALIGYGYMLNSSSKADEACQPIQCRVHQFLCGRSWSSFRILSHHQRMSES